MRFSSGEANQAKGYRRSTRTLGGQCLGWLVYACSGLFAVPSLAQSVEFDFPATRLISVMQDGDSVSASLVGGHTFARVRMTSSSSSTDEDDATEVKCEIQRLWYGESERIAGGAEINRQQYAIFGSWEHESGWVGLFNIDAHQFTWKSEFSEPITAGCLLDGQLVIGDEAGGVRQLQLNSGEAGWYAELHSSQVTAICRVAADIIASADWSGGIKLVDSSTGRELQHFSQHRDRITGLLVLPGTKDSAQPQMVSASRDGTVRLWYPRQRRMVRFAQLEQPVVQLVAIDDQQRVLVATEDGQLHVVDLGIARATATYASGLPSPAGIGQLTPWRWLVLDGLGGGRLWQLPRP